MMNDKDRTPVAQDMIAMCTKCGMELNHVVIAHNLRGMVERVKCHTCGSEHKYRSSKEKAEKKQTVKRTRVTKKPDVQKAYEMLAERFKGKVPVPYSMSGSFKNDDVVDHKTFGTGIVINASFYKIEVAFPDRTRLLVCNR
jgi:hydrogenase maturation factor HypF (carbamoyltransferase family)